MPVAASDTRGTVTKSTKTLVSNSNEEEREKTVKTFPRLDETQADE